MLLSLPPRFTAVGLMVFTAMFLAGCHSQIVRIHLDWNAPMRIHLLYNEREIIPGAPEQRLLARMLETNLPRMRMVPKEDLSTPYRLRFVGRSPEGVRIESVIFVGPNWIGRGGRVAILPERDAIRMRMLIADIIANAPAEDSSANGIPGS